MGKVGENLILFQQEFIDNDSRCHPKYKLLNEPYMALQKDIVEKWADGFEDRDNKFVKEFITTFYGSFWELYIFAVCKKFNLSVDFSNASPDFHITSPMSIYIEAVTANIKYGRASESERNSNNYSDIFYPPYIRDNFDFLYSESIIRISNAISSKSRKYKDRYILDANFDNSVPFVLAVSEYDHIDYGRNYTYGIMAVLYGLHFEKISETYVHKTEIKKNSSGSLIDLGIFFKEEYRYLSAVIFSTTTTIGKLESLLASNDEDYNQQTVINLRRQAIAFETSDAPYRLQIVNTEVPDELEDGVYIFHNPNAINPLPLSIFDHSDIVQYFYSDALYPIGPEYQLVSRYSFPSQCARLIIPTLEKSLDLCNRQKDVL